MIQYQPIGYIKSPFHRPGETPRTYLASGNVTAVLEVAPEYLDAMSDMHPGEQYYVLFHFSHSDHYSLKVKRCGTGPVTGLFSTRAPFRPNPIGLSVITIQKIEGTNITFTGVDMFDGTPVLDIKPMACSKISQQI